MNKTIYSINNFGFRYPYSDKKIHLQGELKIEKSQTLLITGPSGSGKSTLLYALKGLVPETIFGKLEGTILFNDQPITELNKSHKLMTGFLFQNPDAQMINRTVKQELALGLENQQKESEEIEQKINQYSVYFNIENLLNREIKYLSGGEKQKIALISILLMEPEIILFDEPTAFLDPAAAHHFIETFQKISSDRTIIIIEHNRNYLKGNVDRVINIDSSGMLKEKALAEIPWEKSFIRLKPGNIGSKVLNIEKLHFNYKADPSILKGINLELHEGEIISIVGNNGAGKSTLLKLISSQLKASAGIISYPKLDKKTSKKQIIHSVSLLMQNPENHFLFNSVSKEVDSDLILEQTGLSGYQERNPFTLSEGEKRRLSLGIQWSLDRDVYLLDEPTFGQDEKNINLLIKMIDKMRKQGKAFIITSHDRTFVDSISDKIFQLHNGKLNRLSEQRQ